jgi:MinD-like ATPase involved in chromosome partitioning or flagellar assembly
MRIGLALPTASEDRIAADAAHHGHEVVARCSSADELALRLAAADPQVAIVSATERYLTQRLLSHCDDAGVSLLALIGSEQERRHAASIGLFETLPVEAPWVDIEQSLDVAAVAATPPPRAERGTVVAVWGPAGAPGRTTLAIAIAAELASAGHSVALADVDTHSGSIAPALGMLDESPGFAAACRLAGSRSLNATELERIGQRYESRGGGFWVLTGIGRPSRWPELSAERVSGVLAECRKWVDFTVLDTGFSIENDEEISSDLFAPRRNAATITALRDADQVIAVGAADPVGISRFLRAHVDLVETIATDSITVVMNKLRSSAIGLNPAGQVTQTLARFGGVESAVLIPHDQQGMDAAILSGKILADVAPKSPALAAVRQLVESRIAAPRIVVSPVRRSWRRASRAVEA